MGQNYFNTLPLRLQLEELSKCRFMQQDEFADGVEKALKYGLYDLARLENIILSFIAGDYFKL